MIRRDLASRSVLALLSAGALTAACSSAGPNAPSPSGAASAATPTIAVDNRVSPQDTSIGALTAVNGVYGAGCTLRSGPWSVAVGGSSGALANPALSVIKDDTGCTLAITSIVTTTTYTASAAIPLTTSFQASGSAFAAGSSPIAFYANAKLSSASFDADFVLDVVYSDDPSLVSATVPASFTTQTASASSSLVPTPDYAIDLTGLAIQTNVNDVVQVAGGDAVLSFNSVAGQAYAVDATGALSSSSPFATVDAFYQAQTPTPLSGTNPTIAASAFVLGGVTLPAVRTLVVANTQSGVVSYELVRITFDAPSLCPSSFGGSVDQSLYGTNNPGWYSSASSTSPLSGSFTVGRGGALTGIEFQMVRCDGLHAGNVSLALFDASNNTLGTVSVQASALVNACSGAPLTSSAAGPGLFDLTSLCLRVTPGEVINYTLSTAGGDGTCDRTTRTCSNGGGRCFMDFDCQTWIGPSITGCAAGDCNVFQSWVE